jgi:putative serine protease PepD
MIVGPGWPFVGLLAIGLVALLLLPGCGLVVVDRAPVGDARLEAPTLVEADTQLEALDVGAARVAPDRVRNRLRSDLLRIRATGCAGVPTGSGVAVDTKILIADRRVVPGAGGLKVSRGAGAARALGATRVYRLGELGVAQVDGRLPGAPPFGRDTALGAEVAVVGYPLSAKPRLLPGVVIDRVAGTRFGVHGEVLRLTSVLSHGDPGGPVVDAAGRIVGVAFTTDPSTGFTVAVPLSTLRSLVARRALEAAPPCDGA